MSTARRWTIEHACPWHILESLPAATVPAPVVGKQPGVTTIFTASGDQVLRVIVARDVIESTSTTSADTTIADSAQSAGSPETTG